MQTIRKLTGRVRFLTAAIVLLMLTCTPSRAWCGSTNLWIAFDDGPFIASYASRQLKKSGMPTPIQLSTSSENTGLAIDKSHNLWAVLNHIEVVEFKAAQLKKLKTDPSPTPAVIITSTSTFSNIIGCTFDHEGNLWVVDSTFTGSLYELSKAQLNAGSGNVTPAIIIRTSLYYPSFVTFDKVGNAWVDDSIDEIAEFSTSQLTGSGTKSPSVLLSDDGSGTSLSDPGEIVFDKNGDLWVPNEGSDTVVEYAEDQLTSSGNPAPTVKFTSAIFDEPIGAALDSKGNLVVTNNGDGTIAKFTPKQLKVSGAPVPKVAVTGPDDGSFQIIFGPSS
jgi:hypothetical protein